MKKMQALYEGNSELVAQFRMWNESSARVALLDAMSVLRLEFVVGDRAETDKGAANANVHVDVLEKDSVIFDGVRLVGMTLCTDFKFFGLAEREFAMMETAEQMRGFRLIANGKFMDECLNMESFRSRPEACVVIDARRKQYNPIRSH